SDGLERAWNVQRRERGAVVDEAAVGDGPVRGPFVVTDDSAAGDAGGCHTGQSRIVQRRERGAVVGEGTGDAVGVVVVSPDHGAAGDAGNYGSVGPWKFHRCICIVGCLA